MAEKCEQRGEVRGWRIDLWREKQEDKRTVGIRETEDEDIFVSSWRP